MHDLLAITTLAGAAEKAVGDRAWEKETLELHENACAKISSAFAVRQATSQATSPHSSWAQSG